MPHLRRAQRGNLFSLACYFAPLFPAIPFKPRRQPTGETHEALCPDLPHTRTLTPEELDQASLRCSLGQTVTETGITLDPRALGDTAAAFPQKEMRLSPQGVKRTQRSVTSFSSTHQAETRRGYRADTSGPALWSHRRVREWTSPRRLR